MSTKNEELIKEYREALASYPGRDGYQDRNAVRAGFADELADALDAATKPVTVNTVEELDALPVLSVIRVQQRKTLEKLSDGWYQVGISVPYKGFPNWLPATVIFTPRQEGE